VSLLNEMLSNLDTRRRSAVPDSEGLTVNPVEPQPRRWRGWMILIAAALGLVFVADRFQIINLSGFQSSTEAEQHAVNSMVPKPDQGALSQPPDQSDPDAFASTGAGTNLSGDTGEQTLPSSSSVESAFPQDNSMIGGVSEPQAQITESTQSLNTLERVDNLNQQAEEVIAVEQDTQPATVTIGQGAEYILQQPPDYYAVQLVALQDEDKTLQYAADKGLDSPLYLRIFSKGVNWYVLLLGIYPDNSSAEIAVEEWNESGKPPIKTWIRQLGALQKMIVMPDSSVATASHTGTVDHTVEQLLLAAEAALLRERLTSPIHDNAYDRYRRVLQLVPGHPVAEEGLHRIVETYLKLAREYQDSGNLERANWLVGRAEQVSGENPDLVTLRDQLQSNEGSRGPMVAHAARVPDVTAIGSADEEISVKQASGIAKREKALLTEVEGLLQRGAATEARRELEKFLVKYPGSPATVEVLFRLYLQMNKPDLANQLLQHSAQLPASTATKLKAQLQVKQGNLAGAVKTLEEASTNDQDPSYTALLAGLYQKLGRNSEAVSLYRKLLSSEPEQGAYWLGLAVSLDSLQQFEDARSAFQHTIRYGNYDGDVRQYIEQRIQALSR
jgi:tetratricopeptide (TPR) repeat protein